METFYSINQTLFLDIFSLAGKNPLLDSLMVFAADYLIIFIVAISFLLLFRKDEKGKKALLLTLASLVVGFILLKITEFFIYEPRPFLTYDINPLIPKLADNDSFPSDHALISSIMAISYLYYRIKFGILMVIFLIWTGFARVFVGVHYPVDILGGILIGLLAVTISWNLKKVLVKKLRI